MHSFKNNALKVAIQQCISIILKCKWMGWMSRAILIDIMKIVVANGAPKNILSGKMVILEFYPNMF